MIEIIIFFAFFVYTLVYSIVTTKKIKKVELKQQKKKLIHSLKTANLFLFLFFLSFIIMSENFFFPTIPIYIGIITVAAIIILYAIHYAFFAFKYFNKGDDEL